MSIVLKQLIKVYNTVNFHFMILIEAKYNVLPILDHEEEKSFFSLTFMILTLYFPKLAAFTLLWKWD